MPIKLHFAKAKLLDRRVFAGCVASSFAIVPSALAASHAGAVESLSGQANADLHGKARALDPGAELFVGDLVSTSLAGRLVMLLGTATRVNLGSNTRLRIDRYLADRAGELTFDSGPMLIDHDETAHRIGLQLRSPFGLVGLRGTRVFMGPSFGAFGVFVERGMVDFTAAGSSVRLVAGEGSEIRRRGDRPGAVRRWPTERIVDALASVG